MFDVCYQVIRTTIAVKCLFISLVQCYVLVYFDGILYVFLYIHVNIYIYIYIIREEAQSFETHDLRCRACLPNSELAVWWTSVSRWFLV